MKNIKMFVCVIAASVFTNFGQLNVFGQTNQELINMLKEKTNSQEKKDALIKLNQFYSEEKLNSELIKEYSWLVYLAKNNVKAVEYAAELTTKLARNSEVFLYIARTAANADHESTFYSNLLELSLLKLTETEDIINNAIKESVSQLNYDYEAKIKAEINKIRSRPGFESSSNNL